ncbi:DMT family transporter, partial [Acinetobacter baumannii]
HSALHSYTPQHIALLRFLIASVFLLLLVMKKGIQPLNWKDVPALGVLGFFSVTLHHLLINAGQQYVTAVASSILSQSIPLFTFIISAL